MVVSAKPASVTEYDTGDMKLSVIVCDKAEFDQNIEYLRNVICANLDNKRANEQQIELLKQHGHLPLCQRGTKTERLFKKYDIKTDLLAMIVRGKAEQLMQGMARN